MTQANDDAATGPPTGGPVRPQVPQQAGGAPAHPPGWTGPPPPHDPSLAYGWRPLPMPLAPDGRPLADFGTRLLAYLIDSAIVGGVAMVILIPANFALLYTLLSDSRPADGYAPQTAPEMMLPDLVPFLLIQFGFVLFLLVAYYIYYVEMMYRSGQTVGKKLMKVRVVPIEPGATLTRGMAAMRYLVQFPAGTIVPFFSYLDGFWQLWDKPYQQALHDKAAKTVVVKVSP